ncbi:MAG: transcription elongation factor GreA [Candidatus Omnitrophica bacterium]|nr:transcription elongation factor GreA [Candidatus Omnitrophota bacterium]
MDHVYLTRAGSQKLFDELDALKSERLKISRAIEEARLQGDLSENAEYDAAKEAQGYNEARIADLESKLSKVKIIEDENIPGDKIYIGAFVTLQDLDTDEEITYQMVSPEEASYEDNKLSILAPIGKGLLGHAEGEELAIQVPAGTLNYKVLKIKRPK